MSLETEILQCPLAGADLDQVLLDTWTTTQPISFNKLQNPILCSTVLENHLYISTKNIFLQETQKTLVLKKRVNQMVNNQEPKR